jgi:hypothetical protein
MNAEALSGAAVHPIKIPCHNLAGLGFIAGGSTRKGNEGLVCLSLPFNTF